MCCDDQIGDDIDIEKLSGRNCLRMMATGRKSLTPLVTKSRTFVSGMAVIMALVIPGTASAAYMHDGIISAGEYANSFTTEWYNDHQSLKFALGGGQTTTVWWEETADEFRLGTEAPITVKNMIWGDFVSSAAGESEALLYYQAWCSPNDGNPAALYGSNCSHHNDGFDAANAKDPAKPE
jgi:hypothetical protein